MIVVDVVEVLYVYLIFEIDLSFFFIFFFWFRRKKEKKIHIFGPNYLKLVLRCCFFDWFFVGVCVYMILCMVFLCICSVGVKLHKICVKLRILNKDLRKFCVTQNKGLKSVKREN